MINIASLMIFTFTLAMGQVLFKKVGLTMRGLPLGEGMVSVAQAPAFYAALVLYAVATLLWIWILSRVPLSQAYPWVAVGVAVVPLLGWYLFDERITPLFWAGVALIIAGIVVIQYAAASR